MHRAFAQTPPAPSPAATAVPPAAAAQSGASGSAAEKQAPKVEKTAPKPSAPKKPRAVTLLMAEGLRFDPPRIEAKPGELLEFHLENADISHQPHNFVIVKPGMVQEVVKLALEMGADGANKGFIPDHPAILASSGKVVNPEGKVSVKFTVPVELGVYGYVCSIPGHGMVMYGALYVGVPMPLLSKDTNIPQLTLEKGLVGGGRRPFVQRFFMPDSGPASVAVALPGSLNYCFDAGECRVRYVWSGVFMDGSEYWRSSGKPGGELGDVPWWTAQNSPLRIGASAGSKPAPAKFLGYTLEDGVPEFHYLVGKQEVFQMLKPAGNGLEMRFRLPGVKSKVNFLSDSTAVWKCPEGKQKGDVFELPAASAKEFSIFLEQKDPPPPSDKPAPVSLNTHSHSR